MSINTPMERPFSNSSPSQWSFHTTALKSQFRPCLHRQLPLHNMEVEVIAGEIEVNYLERFTETSKSIDFQSTKSLVSPRRQITRITCQQCRRVISQARARCHNKFMEQLQACAITTNMCSANFHERTFYYT